MAAIILNGKEVSKKIEQDLKTRVKKLVEDLGYAPKLATILVGDNPASVTYVNMKNKACARVGLDSQRIYLEENTTTEELMEVIDKLNKDVKVCGILLQHPVPSHIDEQKCFNNIALEKDVDGVNTASFGAMANNLPAFKSATPLGIIKLLEHYNMDITGKNAVVVGRSSILGKPIAMLLLNKNATVTICHTKTVDLPNIIKRADVVVGAVGRPKFIKAEWIKEGAILIDAGYNAGGIGDIDLENAKEFSSAYTPVPGGVGPMTIASLMSQTVQSAEKLAEK